jgi:hypothetical protein
MELHGPKPISICHILFIYEGIVLGVVFLFYACYVAVSPGSNAGVLGSLDILKFVVLVVCKCLINVYFCRSLLDIVTILDRDVFGRYTGVGVEVMVVDGPI